MKIEISQELKQLFKEDGLVVIDDLISKSHFSQLFFLKTGINHFQKSKNIEKILTHKNIGEVLHQLTGERHIRLVYDEVLSKGVVDYHNFPFQGLLIAICIPLSENKAYIFDADIDFTVEEESIAAVYGINETLLIRPESNLDLLKTYKQRGYNIGDRLKSSDSPFVYR